jgi:hypothetical protein
MPLILDRIVAAAHARGLDALTPKQKLWLEDFLANSGGEECEGFAWDLATYPEFGADDVEMLEGKVSDVRLSDLEGGAELTTEEIKLMKETWLENLKEDPDDDVVPGIWTCVVEASDGTKVRTTRLCYGYGWEARRELHRIDPL